MQNKLVLISNYVSLILNTIVLTQDFDRVRFLCDLDTKLINLRVEANEQVIEEFKEQIFIGLTENEKLSKIAEIKQKMQEKDEVNTESFFNKQVGLSLLICYSELELFLANSFNIILQFCSDEVLKKLQKLECLTIDKNDQKFKNGMSDQFLTRDQLFDSFSYLSLMTKLKILKKIGVNIHEAKKLNKIKEMARKSYENNGDILTQINDLRNNIAHNDQWNCTVSDLTYYGGYIRYFMLCLTMEIKKTFANIPMDILETNS